MQEILKAVLETEVDGEKEIDALKLSEKGTAAAKGILRIQKAFADELPKAGESKPEPVMAPEVEAIFKAQKSELEAVRKSLQVETDKRLMSEWVEKTKSDLSHYPGKSTEEIAKMLKDLNDINPDMAAMQFESMKAASAAIKGGVVLKSVGSRGKENEVTAMAQLEAVAAGLVEKSTDSKMTKEQAFKRAVELRPELYAQYLDENSKQK